MEVKLRSEQRKNGGCVAGNEAGIFFRCQSAKQRRMPHSPVRCKQDCTIFQAAVGIARCWKFQIQDGDFTEFSAPRQPVHLQQMRSGGGKKWLSPDGRARLPPAGWQQQKTQGTLGFACVSIRCGVNGGSIFQKQYKLAQVGRVFNICMLDIRLVLAAIVGKW